MRRENSHNTEDILHGQRNMQIERTYAELFAVVEDHFQTTLPILQHVGKTKFSLKS